MIENTSDELHLPTAGAAFWRGVRHVPQSLMCYVLVGTFVGIGALAHDGGFSLTWTVLTTVVLWAGPAQLILMATLTSGASLVQAAVAVALSGIRLLPMVVVLLPQLRTPRTRKIDLVFPAHMTAVTYWVETLRMLPVIPRERRVAFCNGFGLALMTGTAIGTVIGFLLADNLPALFAVAVLFLTPVVFLLSIAHAARELQDWAALGLGLVATPLVGKLDTGVDLLIGAVVAGTLAYGIGRLVNSPRASRDDVAGGGGL